MEKLKSNKKLVSDIGAHKVLSPKNKELSKQLKIPLILNSLLKTKTTQPQAELAEEERQNNLKVAFIAKRPDEVKGKKIFLVDDVYTTG